MPSWLIFMLGFVAGGMLAICGSYAMFLCYVWAQMGEDDREEGGE